MRQAPGPSSRIDITGVFFSMAAPSPVPVTIEPHLMALIYCDAKDKGAGVFEVIFRNTTDPLAAGSSSSESEVHLARNVSPFTVEPGKFTYRLVRGALQLTGYGQIFAHCRVDLGPWLIVPLTLLPPIL